MAELQQSTEARLSELMYHPDSRIHNWEDEVMMLVYRLLGEHQQATWREAERHYMNWWASARHIDKKDLQRSIDSLPGLSVHIKAALRRAHITTIGMLLYLTDEELLQVKNIGEARLKIINEALKKTRLARYKRSAR